MVEFIKVLFSSIYIIKNARTDRYRKSIFPFSTSKTNKSFNRSSIPIIYTLIYTKKLGQVRHNFSKTFSLSERLERISGGTK
ncbi:MAG TPA: hypothetical protein DEP48_02990 [Persephonella sp.]|nr:hypothetical protein [Persephonella sp.]